MSLAPFHFTSTPCTFGLLVKGGLGKRKDMWRFSSLLKDHLWACLAHDMREEEIGPHFRGRIRQKLSPNNSPLILEHEINEANNACLYPRTTASSFRLCKASWRLTRDNNSSIQTLQDYSWDLTAKKWRQITWHKSSAMFCSVKNFGGRPIKRSSPIFSATLFPCNFLTKVWKRGFSHSFEVHPPLE